MRPKKTPVKARGGKGGYEPPAVRMRRDERILELALENRWSQRQIAAEVGLSQVGVHKALRRILRKHVAAVQQDVEAYRVKLLLLAERRGPGGTRRPYPEHGGPHDAAPAENDRRGWHGRNDR